MDNVQLRFSLKVMLYTLVDQNDRWNTVNLVGNLFESLGEIMVKQPKAAPQSAGLEKFYFVNCPVGAEDWELVQVEFRESTVVFEWVEELMLRGYKLSFSLNVQNGLVIASLTDKRKDAPTFGACLTGGAVGWYDALRVLLFKFVTVLKEDLSQAKLADGGSSRIV